MPQNKNPAEKEQLSPNWIENPLMSIEQRNILDKMQELSIEYPQQYVKHHRLLRRQTEYKGILHDKIINYETTIRRLSLDPANKERQQMNKLS